MDWVKMEFEEIQRLVYKEYIQNGYLDMWTVPQKGYPKGYTEEQRIADLAELGLINTEIAEAQEATRRYGYPLLLDKWGNELTDIIIRAMNFASRKGIQLEPYLLTKHKQNLERGVRHGKKI